MYNCIMKNNKILISQKIKKPYFSVITVVKNDEKNISLTLRSIKNQTFRNFEYLVIDGASTDSTINKIFKFKSNIHYLLSEKDRGIYFAMNKGLKLCRGQVVLFLNSGDTLTRNALKIVRQKFKKKEIDFVFGTVKRHYTKNTILKYGFNLNKLKYNFDFATSHSSGFFLKRKIYNKLRYFDTKYQCSADYDIYLKAIMKMRLKGGATKKTDLIGIVKAGGFSSKFGFFNHLIEEFKIRLNNNQNIFFVIAILVNAILKKLLKKF